ncbi:unnamed protein product [Calypogeia fissa]
MGVEGGDLPIQGSLLFAWDLLLEEVRVAVPALEELAFDSPNRVQQVISDHMHQHSLASMLSEAPSDAVQACLLSYAGTGSSAWLSANPEWAPFRMSSFIFTTSLRVRLGHPHPGLLGQPSYVCGHTLDPMGTHILRCSHGSEWTATHDDLCNVLAAMARDTSYHVSTEHTHVLLAVDDIPDQRWANIVFSRDGVWALADVVVVDSIGANMVSSVAHILGMRPLTQPRSRRKRISFAITRFILPLCS